jgi:predicted RNA-binding protein
MYGESLESLEVFEDLWQKVLSSHEPKNRVALILPCVFGKPYWQSYLMHWLLMGILSSVEGYVSAGQNGPPKRKDII